MTEQTVTMRFDPPASAEELDALIPGVGDLLRFEIVSKVLEIESNHAAVGKWLVDNDYGYASWIVAKRLGYDDWADTIARISRDVRRRQP